jgi:murein DD-endopeptidase MepM/ murein hydrolase activator NlpD
MAILIFPIPKWEAKYNYHQGGLRFGANRDHGKRKHVGCDLYGPLGSPVLAITNGTVIRVYRFYGGTDAIEINHGSLGIARYGEIPPSSNIKTGGFVDAGEQIGTIATIKGHGKLHPMMHFELYSGQGNGRLTQPGSKGFQRRSDLVNPTPLLDQLRFGGIKKCSRRIDLSCLFV